MSLDLTIKPTEVEIAESISFADPVTARVIRRLAFQRDQLNAENERLRGVIDKAWSALEFAKDTIADWHGETAWDLYQQSPEMVEINTALDKCREALEGTT